MKILRNKLANDKKENNTVDLRSSLELRPGTSSFMAVSREKRDRIYNNSQTPGVGKYKPVLQESRFSKTEKPREEIKSMIYEKDYLEPPKEEMAELMKRGYRKYQFSEERIGIMLNNYLNHSIEGNKNKNRHINTKESIDRESESNSPCSPSKKLLKNANNKNSSDLNFESHSPGEKSHKASAEVLNNKVQKSRLSSYINNMSILRTSSAFKRNTLFVSSPMKNSNTINLMMNTASTLKNPIRDNKSLMGTLKNEHCFAYKNYSLGNDYHLVKKAKNNPSVLNSFEVVKNDIQPCSSHVPCIEFSKLTRRDLEVVLKDKKKQKVSLKQSIKNGLDKRKPHVKFKK